MDKTIGFEIVSGELIKIRQDYNNDKDLCYRVDNILKQHYVNMIVVHDIVTKNIKQGEI